MAGSDRYALARKHRRLREAYHPLLGGAEEERPGLAWMTPTPMELFSSYGQVATVGSPFPLFEAREPSLMPSWREAVHPGSGARIRLELVLASGYNPSGVGAWPSHPGARAGALGGAKDSFARGVVAWSAVG